MGNELGRAKNYKLAMILTIVGNIIWGSGFIFLKIGMRFTSPTLVLTWRFAVAFLIMNIWLIIGKKKITFKGKELKSFAIFILIEPVCFLVEIYAIKATSSSFTGIAQATSPIAAMLLATIFLKEKPTRNQLLFSCITVIGAVLVTIAGKSIGVASTTGIVLVFTYMFCSGIYKTANRGASKNFDMFERTYCLIGICAVTYTIYGLIETKCDFSIILEPMTHTTFMLIILSMAILNSVVANAFVNYGAGVMTTANVASMASVQTLTSGFGGIVLLHEPSSVGMIFGGALIILGVWLIAVKGK